MGNKNIITKPISSRVQRHRTLFSMTSQRISHICTWFTFVFLFLAEQNEQKPSPIWIVYPGWVISYNGVGMEHYGVTSDECKYHCLSLPDGQCKGVDYRPLDGRCSFNGISLLEASGSWLAESSYVLYEYICFVTTSTCPGIALWLITSIQIVSLTPQVSFKTMDGCTWLNKSNHIFYE